MNGINIQKLLEDPDYIYSYEFVMKHSNFKYNKDGTISFIRPVPFKDNNDKV